MIGLNAQRRLVFGNGLLQPAGRARQRVCQVDVRVHKIGVDAQRRPVLGDGVRQPVGNAG